MYDHHGLYHDGFRNSLTDEDRNRILDALAEQRWADFEDDSPVLSGRGAPMGFDENTDPIGREFGEFYSTPRGYHPNSITQFTLTSELAFMNFPLLSNLEWISPRPILFVTGEHAHSGISRKTPTSSRPSRRNSTSFRTPATSTCTTRRT
jgi:hypothetical protein